MNLLITQNSQNLQHSHSFSGSHSHNHNLLSWNTSSDFGGNVAGFNRSSGGTKAYGVASVISGNNLGMSYYNVSTGNTGTALVQSATVTISGYTGTSGSSTESRPVDFTYKVWKRTD